jgi:hypothetical protein
MSFTIGASTCIDVRYHFILQCIEEGKINVEHASTDAQLADILTKPLGRTRFLELRVKIGMVTVIGHG